MNILKQRILFGLGAALLVGGWGGTRFANKQQQTVPAGLGRELRWSRYDEDIYRNGVVAMALGAGLIGFGAIRTRKETE